MLDMLCLAGEVGWARLSMPKILKLASVTPIALFLREHGDAWHALRPRDGSVEPALTDDARVVLARLRSRGASFFNEIASGVEFDQDRLRQAMGILVAAGLAVSDGFSGLRLLAATAQGRLFKQDRRASFAGRWAAVRQDDPEPRDDAVEHQARTLLKRYGIVFRRLLTREPNAAPWRELVRVYRRLEARGEIRGGRFVTAMSGEQFARPDAVERLREIRRTPPSGTLHVISAADPLNLTGLVTTGDRVRAVAANRVVYRDGVPLAAMEGDYVRPLVEDTDGATASAVTTSLTGRSRPAVVSGFLGRS
jgi:ATP-dependent Lhr-like helicase